jgi:hypothetical protein
MGDRGKRDKGGREKRKKAKLDIKEKRKLRREREHGITTVSTVVTNAVQDHHEGQ